ncbi:hypothetical protein GGR28_000240 [Lewinella aquimaris]|uniref:DUF3857 domain-containing protein n=1 Tax=Neolewinella aquimaris TaxID=1835722 RepID=A0A840E762_9BACT|nr:DUF3857 domain-containing protein [Neolewinella aquimaris]MBB4077639.1 hypothetical protein [Neolewinella aquimaris]
MHHPFTLAFSILFLFATNLSAQYEDGLKFGKITDEDRQLLLVPGDSAAAAYVLYDKLDLSFDFLPDKGPVLKESFHRRVKLLKPSSFDRANITLRYDRSFQSLGNLDAQVHLPDGTTIKLRGGDFVREKGDDRKETMKFTFPQITPGAVIEYRYTLSTESILTPTNYVFQEDIPVRWAEYTARIPKYYSYLSLGMHGNYHIREVEQRPLRWSPVALRGLSNEQMIMHSDMRFVMKDIVPFKHQPYTNNLRDYLPRVRLQLQSVQYPQSMVQPVLKDWHAVANELDELRNFGRAYQVKGNYNQLWKAAGPTVMAAESPRERIAAAYYFVASRIRWDERYHFIGSDSPDNIFKAGVGNSADLNLCLLALLNEAGIDAQPMLVSLRDGGVPIEVYPLVDQFDHLMVYATVGEGSILLDANGVSRPPGLPRERALNHRGWIASTQNPRWTSVEVPRARRVMLCEMSVDEAGLAEVDLTGRLESYFAHSGRLQLKKMKDDTEAPIASDILTHFPEATVVSKEIISGGDHSAQPLTYKVRMNVAAGMASDDYLYIQPILLPLLDAELDDVQERLYPIDFPYPWREQYITNVTVPEGYAVEELPESIRLRSEDGGMEATYTAVAKPDRTITINFSVDLDRTVYQAADYATLRAMYRRIIELQEASIVLKRAK